MKILIVHNGYHYRGGEGVVVEAEARLLAEHGHEVITYYRTNDELNDRGFWSSFTTGIEAIWAPRSYRELKQIITREKPHVAHFHNTFPLISPSAYYACAEANVAVVQTLHNYRLLCPGANLVRDGAVCESCVGRSVAWPGVLHGCYHGSVPQTAAVAGMLAVHKTMHTWQAKVDLYVAISEFARQKFIQGGLPANRVVVKPNFVHPDIGPKSTLGEYALFVGRLSEEKGLQVLVQAWSQLTRAIPLYIVGDGPMHGELRSAANANPQIRLIGSVPRKEVFDYMHRARFLISSSICYEAFGIAVAEAFACGLPVIVPRLGSLEEIVVDGRTGLHFAPGNVEDLAAKVEWAWMHSKELDDMGRAGRAEFELKYTAQQNYLSLMRIYEQAQQMSKQISVGNEVIEGRAVT